MPQNDRTERATPKRRKDAREKGQVARSMEINSALIILAVFFALRTFGGNIIQGLDDMMRYFLQSPASYEIDQKAVETLFISLSIQFLKLLLPVALVALVIGVVSSLAQTGLMFTTKTITPDLKKLSPLAGIKRLLSARAFVELIKSIIKIAIIGYIVYSIIASDYMLMVSTMDMDIRSAVSVFGAIAYEIGMKTGLALLILALADYLYQRYAHEKSIRMTKQQIKDEHKQTEGDPAIKSRIRRKQMEVMMRRMMQSVPTADVVITNPVHLAIAIKYDADTMPAPRVVAKGQRLVAERIKEIARENDVPIVEDKPLAQAMYRQVEIDQEIPFDLYKAVAEILAYVYQLNKRHTGQSAGRR